jgi:hypothetical protein
MKYYSKVFLYTPTLYPPSTVKVLSYKFLITNYMNIPNIKHSTFITYNNPKGNISLIMLFVLAIGSLIGLMSTNSVQDMITST